MLIFALTIFLSAFLLFQIQPMMGKFILPWFGGGPSVWTTALLFFQLLLLGGYLYAHALGRIRSGRTRLLVHAGLLSLSVLWLPVAPDAETWKPKGPGEPATHILLLLLATVGLPYFLLSSTGPLLQRWFHDAFPHRSPYRLYSLSNAGSLLALLSYPVLIEPWLPLGRQTGVWSLVYVAFILGSVSCAWRGVRHRFDAATPPVEKPSRPSLFRMLLWLVLAASASAMLMAVTNQISLEVSVIPFLWVVPLALYLITFIVAFERPRGYDRRVLGPLLVLAAAGGTLVWGTAQTLSLPVIAFILCFVLFVCCMTCHGELARSRPHPKFLTGFYLVVAAGGALGGIFVALVAPRIYSGFWEFPTALAACCTMALMAWLADQFGGSERRTLFLGLPLSGGLLILFWTLVGAVQRDAAGFLFADRNFYGVIRISESTDARGIFREMQHGQVSHGLQYLDPDLQSRPTTYFGPTSGVGQAILGHPRPAGSLRLGVIGLGVGTLAAYAAPGDTVRFYEIDPQVIEAADSWFSFLDRSSGHVEIASGDARVVMERETRERPGRFDVLVVDAFSSGSVPAHLLTAEASEIYRAHLSDDGLIALHVSNDYLDLIPVGLGIARHLGAGACLISDLGDEPQGTYPSDWLLVSRNPELLAALAGQGQATMLDTAAGLLWTDHHASVWSIVTW